MNRIKMICDKESVKITESGLEAVISTSEGDLRKAITSLQSCARLKTEEEVTEDDVYEITGVIPSKFLEGLLEVCQLNSYERLQVGVYEF